MYIKNNKYNNSNEYEKTINFLEKYCKCNCFLRIFKKEFAKLRKFFQVFFKSKQNILT